MTTRIAICNQSLVMLGQDRILSIDDDNPRAEACKDWYETAVESVLESHNWSFAIFRASLNRTTDPTFEYAHAFALPNNPRYLKFISHDKHVTMPYAIEGGLFLCDESAVAIRYVGRQAEGFFSGGFSSTVSAYIAEKICWKLTESASLKKQMMADYQVRLRQAGQNDMLEQKSQKAYRSGRTDRRRPFAR